MLQWRLTESSMGAFHGTLVAQIKLAQSHSARSQAITFICASAMASLPSNVVYTRAIASRYYSSALAKASYSFVKRY